MKKKREDQITQSFSLADYLEGWSSEDGGKLPGYFVKVYPPLAIATSLAEATFLSRFLFMWMAKKQVKDNYGDGERLIIKRRAGYGIYIKPAYFCRQSGLSQWQFRQIVRKYEEVGILKTRVDKVQANRKYYRLRLKKLEEYLDEVIHAAWHGIVIYEK